MEKNNHFEKCKRESAVVVVTKKCQKDQKLISFGHDEM